MHALNSSGRITERSSMTWPSFFIGYCWGIGNRWLCCVAFRGLFGFISVGRRARSPTGASEP